VTQRAGLTLLTALILASSSGALQETRKPVPEAAAQKNAEKTIRDVFKEDYAKRTPADKAALAKKLVDNALRSGDDPASQFVLLQEARELASQAGDTDTALGAIKELSARFAVDAWTLKTPVLAALAKNAKRPEDWRSLARAYLALADEAAESEDFDAASKAVESAVSLSKKAKDVPLATSAEARNKEIAAFRERSEAAKKARAELAKNPEDPAANLILGSYECFVCSRWPEGLACLAKGSDPALKALALKEQAAGTDASELLAVGDGWWDLAEKASGAVRASQFGRAVFWYQKAIPLLSGLNKLRVDKRLLSAYAERQKDPGWVDVTVPALFGLEGAPGEPMKFDKYAFTIKPFPEGDFDGVSAKIRLVSADAVPAIQYAIMSQLVCLDAEDKSIAFQRNAASSGWKIERKAALPPKDGYVVAILLEGDQIVVSLDGNELFRFKRDLDKLSALRLSNVKGVATFEQVRLRRKR